MHLRLSVHASGSVSDNVGAPDVPVQKSRRSYRDRQHAPIRCRCNEL